MELDRDFGTICICAVRYALGRQTYMPSIVQQFVVRNIKQIDTKSLAVIDRDIKNAPSYGDEVLDRPGWLNFQAWIENELRERGYVDCL